MNVAEKTNEKKIMRTIMKLKGVSQTKLAEMIGLKRQSSVGEILQGSGTRVGTMVKVLNALDCELVVRSKVNIPLIEGDAQSTTVCPEFVIKLEEE